jgi:hypothetical protein
MDLLKRDVAHIFHAHFLFYVGILYPSGEPISLHLLRYRAFAVEDHGGMPCASYLQRPRLVNNPG